MSKRPKSEQKRSVFGRRTSLDCLYKKIIYIYKNIHLSSQDSCPKAERPKSEQKRSDFECSVQWTLSGIGTKVISMITQHVRISDIHCI